MRRAPGKLRNLEEVIRRAPIFPPERSCGGAVGGSWGSGTPAGRRMGGRPKKMPIRTATAPGGSSSSITELSRTTWSSSANCQAEGHVFVTETDTEIIAHLIEQEIKSAAESGKTMPLEEAVRRAARRLTGAYAISVISADEPDKIVAARNGPPAVIGIGEGEYFVASDVPGILHHTRNLHFLGDGDVAILTREGVHLTDIDGQSVAAEDPAHSVGPDPGGKGRL